ncbi:hypothetical protein CLAFUW4_02785 [Fulvia fulva]|uniref:Uncharacterized protein n=1 Tax=Passalora fulva TaxID=5499 RepID=A0A9Q8LAG7_PASFU|nr:uncharacterized protein CLAFUR5_02772 [Fulvia fulva]KAK4631539.1 hypothetical protein CLAFUR4_02779 [Fulvia fulva]UJO13837.1 hypothetical protein CLAFUR5_02772 [Fulvia fulva]WPV10609.1 hypothetical protein CLAFUW4_02785 [Fulvia fulva]WPV25677.1 hypothetical protein CLAFUW7_02783 [Fulvia fulva]
MPRKARAANPTQTLIIQGNEDVPSALENKVTNESLAKCNMQSQSPLFGVLPPELRNDIFELATQPYDDERHVYKPNAYFYRPGHHAKQKVDTASMLTCRRVWLEANYLPMRQFEPTFWFKGEERRPDWTHQAKSPRSKYNLRHSRPSVNTTEENRYKTFVVSLTAANVDNLQTLHFLGQLYWLESDCLHLLLTGGSIPTVPHVKVTVRHTDWWWWESDEELRLDYDWIVTLLAQTFAATSTSTFELQLETLSGKVPQLEAIIEDIKEGHSMITERDGDRYWKLQDESGKEVLAWDGPADVGGIRWRMAHSADGEKLEYRVHSLVWKRNGA